MGASEPCWASAHDGNWLILLFGGLQYASYSSSCFFDPLDNLLGETRFVFINFDSVFLRDKTFKRTDGDGSVYPSPPASRFAGSTADAAADRSERIGSPRNPVCFFVLPGGDGLHIPARISVHRATGLALDVLLPIFIIRNDRLKLLPVHENPFFRY